MRLKQLGMKIWVFMHACIKMTAEDPFFVRLLLLNLSAFYVTYSALGVEAWNIGYSCMTLGAFFVTNLLFAFCCMGLGRKGKLAVLVVSAAFSLLDALAYITIHQAFYLSYRRHCQDKPARGSGIHQWQLRRRHSWVADSDGNSSHTGACLPAPGL